MGVLSFPPPGRWAKWGKGPEIVHTMAYHSSPRFCSWEHLLNVLFSSVHQRAEEERDQRRSTLSGDLSSFSRMCQLAIKGSSCFTCFSPLHEFHSSTACEMHFCSYPFKNSLACLLSSYVIYFITSFHFVGSQITHAGLGLTCPWRWLWGPVPLVSNSQVLGLQPWGHHTRCRVWFYAMRRKRKISNFPAVVYSPAALIQCCVDTKFAIS